MKMHFFAVAVANYRWIELFFSLSHCAIHESSNPITTHTKKTQTRCEMLSEISSRFALNLILCFFHFSMHGSNHVVIVQKAIEWIFKKKIRGETSIKLHMPYGKWLNKNCFFAYIFFVAPVLSVYYNVQHIQ